MASSKEWECAYHLEERIVPIASVWCYQTTYLVRDLTDASKVPPERRAMALLAMAL